MIEPFDRTCGGEDASGQVVRHGVPSQQRYARLSIAVVTVILFVRGVAWWLAR
jgi:hypothetical protein